MATDEDNVLLIGGCGGCEVVDYTRDIFSLKTGAGQWELEETELAFPSGGGPTPLRFRAENLYC